ncbi:hypothetical protein [Photobacterium lipolyticum]|uniref:Uncharacterized protein n=1 Tax=Photobacterium lipolyticum TaxID=266810 RepID=A0A2T3MSA5_9GAMM|nr:hypothetical protein [Photobacterium lipolyticum]PSW00658.1 hypothetical protein C9I89_20830 [Photobacterium lipolyticum]
MIYRIVSLAAASVLLSGCISTKLTPPPSDYQGNLPEVYKTELNTLNDVPSTPFRGGVQTFQFDAERSLLTIVFRLPNPHWYWDINKPYAEKDMFPYACKTFSQEINNDLGVRFWYLGNGGFVTDVVSKETCTKLRQSEES